MHAHTCTNTHAQTHTHACTHTHTHTHMYTHTHTHTHARTHVCTYALLTLFNCVVCCWGNHSCCDFAENTTGTWSGVELSVSKSPQTCLYTVLPISCLLFCSVCVYVLYVCGGLYITVRSVHQFLWISCIFYLCNRVYCIHVPGYDPTLFFPVLFLFDWVGVLWPQLSKVLKPVHWVGSIPFPPVSLQKQVLFVCLFAVAAGVHVFISGESLHCFLVGWCANKKLCYSNLWLVTLHSCFQPAFLNSPPHSLTFVLCIALSAVVKCDFHLHPHTSVIIIFLSFVFSVFVT